MESAGLPGSARSWLEEQGYTDSTIEELHEIGDDEVDALIQRVENSGEGSEVERVRCALCGVRFVHLGQLRRTGFFSFFGGGRMRWSCCQSYDVEVMWCSEAEVSFFFFASPISKIFCVLMTLWPASPPLISNGGG